MAYRENERGMETKKMKEMKIEVKLDEERTKARYRMSDEMNVGELGMCALSWH